jgi:hypothetical protein
MLLDERFSPLIADGLTRRRVGCPAAGADGSNGVMWLQLEYQFGQFGLRHWRD